MGFLDPFLPWAADVIHGSLPSCDVIHGSVPKRSLVAAHSSVSVANDFLSGGGLGTTTTSKSSAHASRIYAAFLSSPGGDLSAGSSYDVCLNPFSDGKLRTRRVKTGFHAPPKYHGPELGKVEVYLDYASDDIYDTDFGAYDKKMFKHKFAATVNHEPAIGHPRIRFRKLERQIHCRLVDTYNGRVFWDADYKMGWIPFMGGMELSGKKTPMGGDKPLMENLWIPEDDPGPHLFDLSISTSENWYDDQADTRWGPLEGFDSLRGSAAHIGLKVVRMPKIEDENEVVRENGDGSKAPIHTAPRGMEPMQAKWLRDVHDEENPFKDALTGDPGTFYYGWMYGQRPREKNNYAYLFAPKNTIPPLIRPYSYVKKSGFGAGQKPVNISGPKAP